MLGFFTAALASDSLATLVLDEFNFNLIYFQTQITMFQTFLSISGWTFDLR